MSPPSLSLPRIGRRGPARSPVSIEELGLIQQTLSWTEDDAASLARAGEILRGCTDVLVEAWLDELTRQPHLAAQFGPGEEEPDEAARTALHDRLTAWVRVATSPPFDRAWLDEQHVIAERLAHRSGDTDAEVGGPGRAPLRYLTAFSFHVATSVRPHLEAGAAPDEDVEALHRAWAKTVFLHVAVWSRSYAGPDTW